MIVRERQVDKKGKAYTISLPPRRRGLKCSDDVRALRVVQL